MHNRSEFPVYLRRTFAGYLLLGRASYVSNGRAHYADLVGGRVYVCVFDYRDRDYNACADNATRRNAIGDALTRLRVLSARVSALIIRQSRRATCKYNARRRRQRTGRNSDAFDVFLIKP